jgi:hypothetical protein
VIANAVKATLKAQGRRWLLVAPEHASSHLDAANALLAWFRLGQPIAHVLCLDRLLPLGEVPSS